MTTATHTQTITLRLAMTPNRALAPNRNNGKMRWITAPKIAADREMAWICAMDGVLAYSGITDPVRVTVTIYWGKLLGTDGKMRQARRLDWDSATALCKPMLDGALMDTGILADDSQIKAGTVLQEVAADGEGYTVIEITPMGEGV